jgi:hypothetical protein
MCESMSIAALSMMTESESENKSLMSCHRTVTQDLRAHLQSVLLKLINRNGENTFEPSVASKIEENAFKLANSRHEYYHLMAEGTSKMLDQHGALKPDKSLESLLENLEVK